MLYINNSGKILAATVAAAAVAEKVTGEDLGVARTLKIGCLTWMAWVALVLTSVYWLVFK